MLNSLSVNSDYEKKCFYSEVKEECGLDVTELRKIALIEFELENNPVIMEVHVFDTYKFDGKVIESEGEIHFYIFQSTSYNDYFKCILLLSFRQTFFNFSRDGHNNMYKQTYKTS